MLPSTLEKINNLLFRECPPNSRIKIMATYGNGNNNNLKNIEKHTHYMAYQSAPTLKHSKSFEIKRGWHAKLNYHSNIMHVCAYKTIYKQPRQNSCASVADVT